MQIHNVRLGLATNSSSSHSLIFLPNAKDALLDEDGSFGWEPFMAASAGQKNRYVALTLYTAMARLTTPEIARLIVKEWSGIALEEVYPGEVNGSVDHQSVYDLPTDWAGKVIDHEFFEDFRGFFLREGLVILGGNDNDERHPLDGKGSFRLPLNQDCHPGDVVCRKDPDGWWTTFNRKTGAKIRLSFAEGKTVTPMKSHAPELCDVKVTDYCNSGCQFCAVPGTMVETPTGPTPIEALQIGDTVLTQKSATAPLVTALVTQVFERFVDEEIVVLELADGTVLRLTTNHEVFTNRGWILAGELTEQDEVHTCHPRKSLVQEPASVAG